MGSLSNQVALGGARKDVASNGQTRRIRDGLDARQRMARAPAAHAPQTMVGRANNVTRANWRWVAGPLSLRDDDRKQTKASVVAMQEGAPAMSVIEQVEKLIARLAPDAICDDCIADKLDLSVRQHVSQKTRELAGSHGFVRAKDVCSICGATKLVIRRQR